MSLSFIRLMSVGAQNVLNEDTLVLFGGSNESEVNNDLFFFHIPSSVRSASIF